MRMRMRAEYRIGSSPTLWEVLLTCCLALLIDAAGSLTHYLPILLLPDTYGTLIYSYAALALLVLGIIVSGTLMFTIFVVEQLLDRIWEAPRGGSSKGRHMPMDTLTLTILTLLLVLVCVLFLQSSVTWHAGGMFTREAFVSGARSLLLHAYAFVAACFLWLEAMVERFRRRRMRV